MKYKRVTLISPHTCEHPVTLPFQKALAKKLEGEGIFVQQKQDNSMKKRIMDLRKRLGNGTTDEENAAFNCMLLLQDRLVRAERMSGLVLVKGTDTKSTFAMELHAYDVLRDKEDFRKIGGTQLWIENYAPMEPLLQSNLLEKLHRIAAKLGFDVEGMRNELRAIKRKLSECGATLKLLEIQGEAKDLEGVDRTKMSDAEYRYCFRMVSPREPLERELDAVVRIIVP